MPMPYKFFLVCPRCDKESETVQDSYIPAPVVHCGDCLMDRTEVVRMKVVVAEQIAAFSE